MDFFVRLFVSSVRNFLMGPFVPGARIKKLFDQAIRPAVYA